MTTPPFRFGIQLGIDSDWPALTTREAWRELAKRIEGLGYSTLSLADHYRNTFAPLPALVAAAEATTVLRVGTLVLNNDLRHPIAVANEFATLDILSGGRAELGIGAGWDDADYAVSGIVKDPPPIRVARLAEALRVIDGYFSGRPFTFRGDHYTVTDLVGAPLSIQRPRPPLLIGGGGRRVLALAATEADIVGINPTIRGAIGPDTGAGATAAATDAKVRWVREAAGNRADRIALSLMVFHAVVTDDPEGAARSSWFTRDMGLRVEDSLASPHMLAGPVDRLEDVLRERRERWGVGYWVFQGVEAMEALAPVVHRLAGA